MYNKKIENRVIDLYFKNTSLNQIMEKTNLKRYEVISYLSKYRNKMNCLDGKKEIAEELDNFIRDNVSEIELTSDSKFLIISDTHIGSNDENLKYLDMAYNYATKNNIDTILHGGDLMDGLIDCRHSKYKTYESQMERIVTKYPKDELIRNYILFGNHDYKFMKNGYDLEKFIEKERDDFISLGFKKGYIKIFDQFLSVQHEIKRYKLIIPNINTFMDFKGHAHVFSINEEKNIIHVPTLSDNHVNGIRNNNDLPGFIEISVSGNKKLENLELSAFHVNEEVEFYKKLEYKRK